KPEDKPKSPDTKDVQPISKPEDKQKSPLDIVRSVPHVYSSDESEEEFDKPKLTDTKQVLPLVSSVSKPEDKDTKDVQPISKPEDKPKSPDTKDVQPISKPEDKQKSPLDIVRPVPHVYSSDESKEEFDKPKLTDMKEVLPLVSSVSKPEDKDTKDVQPISKPEDKPKSPDTKDVQPISKPEDKQKSPLDIVRPVPHVYSSDESEGEFDKPKLTDMKEVLPLVSSVSKPEDKDTKDVQPISKPEDKQKSPLDIVRPVPHVYSSDESKEEFDKPKLTDMKEVLPLVSSVSKPEDKDTKDVQPISKPEDKPKSPLDIVRPVPYVYSSDESEGEFDKPKLTDMKEVLPLVSSVSKPEDKDTKDVQPISKPEDKPKSPLDIVRPVPYVYSSDESEEEFESVPHVYSSDESEKEFDKPKLTDMKEVLPLVSSISKPEDKDTKDAQPISNPEDKPKSPLDIVRSVPHVYSSDESEKEFDKPKLTDMKEVLPLVSSISKPEDKKKEFDKPKLTDMKKVLPLVLSVSKPEDKDTKDVQPISKPEDEPKSPLDVAKTVPHVYASDESEEKIYKPKMHEVSRNLRPLLSIVPGADMTTSEEVPFENECCRFSTSLSNRRDILDSCSSLDSLERAAFQSAGIGRERGVVYFVNLDESKEIAKKNGEEFKKALANKKLNRAVKKRYASSINVETKVTVRKSLLQSNGEYSKTEKVYAAPPRGDVQKTTTNNKAIANVSSRQKKNLKNKDEVSKLSIIKASPSPVRSEVYPDRSTSLRAQTVNVGLSEDNSHSRSTTPRPRTRTDVTTMPYNATLRTFSPISSRPKADYSHVTSVYAQTPKYDKKTTTKKTKTKTITKSSEPSVEDAQRKRLSTPTSTVMHRYMQPTLAHSLRYAHTQSTSKQADLASDTALRSKSPGPAMLQPKGKQLTTPITSTTTNTDAQRRYVRNLSKEEKTLNFKSSLTNLKKDSLSNSKESIKSTEKLYNRKPNVDKPKAVIAHSEQVTDKSMSPKTSKEMSNILNKSNQSKIRHKINRPKDNAKLDVSTGRTHRSVTRDSSEETKVLTRKERTQHRSKVPISVSSNITTRRIIKTTRTESNLGEIKPRNANKAVVNTDSGPMKTDQPKKRNQTRKSDVKVQKKIKDSINESSMTGSDNTSASGSLSSVRKYTRTTTNIKKLDKDVANLRLAEKSVFTTSKISKIPAVPTRTTVVKVNQEPVAAIVSTVIIDDDAEITRSFKSTESTKSSTSSSGSRKVLTSEVFTKTFGPDKAFEVIYRQPDNDMDLASIARPPSTDQRCTNEFDVSFIDTTDSSLSDSIALPMFNTEQDRLLAASPGSPKPTRSPLALIEETLRRQQAGYAVDPALQMQFGASGIRIGSISPTSSRNSRSEQNETPKGK
ncbi:microtubule-associated protein futsch-like, partial [Bactrocera oleae]|uniref:microtubule-associated protein futsch-like n=1 Tax=Bactrocera oleae TaxID=104688 RepID=UPI00387E6067